MLFIERDSAGKHNMSMLCSSKILIDTMSRGVQRGWTDIGLDLVKTAKSTLTTGAKTGRVYKFRGGLHQASAPGEAPANRTGNLRKSLSFKARSHELEFGYQAPYGKYLEWGTRKMAPRPNLLQTGLDSYKRAANYQNNRIGLSLRQLFR